MRKVLAVLAVLICSSFCEARERFITFPALGKCTGKYVRYREAPDIDSKILGRLNKPERVIVLGRTAVNGQIWYEIEDPKSDKTAFVFGKYIVPYYNETAQQSPIVKLIVNILHTYGITEEQSKFYDGPKVNTDYNEIGELAAVEAWKNGSVFGEICIGDDVKVLEEILGEPDIKRNTDWAYKAGKNTVVGFLLEDGKIRKMIYSE